MASPAFGSAYGSTPNNKYILLGFGEPAGQGTPVGDDVSYPPLPHA
jgi:hypothetical protein